MFHLFVHAYSLFFHAASSSIQVLRFALDFLIVCLWIQYKLYQHASVTNIYIYTNYSCVSFTLLYNLTC